MLRNIIIFIGLLVALNPYLGFPDSIDKFILTTLGLLLVFLVALSRRPKSHHDAPVESEDNPVILHVERTEVEDTPQLHIERTTTVDREMTHDTQGENVEVEKKTTVVRRRKQKQNIENLSPEDVS